MILHRLEVAGFRCFTSKVTVVLDPHRINILHGGNGTGKSSLLWALVRGLLDTYRAGGKSVEALRPWGTDLGPEIVVEFEHDGKVFRLEKNLLESRGAHLEEKQGNKFKPLANNEKAEERVREMLLAGQPMVGLCKPEKWGLARALWCPQEHLAVDGFDGRVLGNIQELLGKQALDPAALELKQQVEEAFLEYWTDKGKPKGGKGAPLCVRRRAELTSRQEELAACERELEDLRAAQETALALQEKRLMAQSRLEEVNGAIAQWQAKAEDYVPLVSLCEKLKAQRDAKRAEAVALENTVKRISDLRERQQRSTKRLVELDVDIRKVKASEAGLQRAFGEVDERMKTLQKGDAAVTALEQVTTDADNYNRLRRELHDIQLCLERVEKSLNQISQWRERAGRLQAPDQETLAELEELSSRRLQLQTQLDNALLHVELRPNEGRRVEVFQGEPSGFRVLLAGEALRVGGSPVVDLDLEGFGHLTVTGPAQSAKELKEQLGKVLELIGSFAFRFGTSNIAELRQRRQESMDIESQSASEEKTVRGLLSGRTVDSLKVHAERLLKEAETAESMYAGWREAPPDLGLLKLQLDEARKAFEGRRCDVAALWKQRQTELANVREEHARFAAEAEHLRKQATEDQAQLSALRSDGLSDPDRSLRLSQLSVDVLGLEGKYSHESNRLQDLGADPRPALKLAQRDLVVADDAFQKAGTALHEHRGALKKMLARAPYEQCARFEEEIEQLREEINRDQLRADALKLLRETIDECEDEATAGIAGPVAERASKLLHLIAGKRIGAISLSDGLAPLGVGPADTDETIDLEILSGGEREQVHLAIRLALAELLTKDAGQRQLVVLDDVLTATDDQRLKPVLAILDEMRPHAQFLILTCHPARYKVLRNAKFIDIQAVRKEGLHSTGS